MKIKIPYQSGAVIPQDKTITKADAEASAKSPSKPLTDPLKWTQG